jgi:hypothetical protein
MERRWRFVLILVAAGILWSPLGGVPRVEAQKYEFKVSLETVPNHQNHGG